MRERNIKIDGQRYSYYVLGSGKKHVVMLHGLACSKDHMAWLLSHLKKDALLKTYRFIIPDLFGHNSIPIYGEGTHIAQAGYIMRLVSQLKIKEYAIVGFSYGSIVALEISAKSRRKIPMVLWASPIAGTSFPARVSFRLISFMPSWLYHKIADSPLSIPVSRFLEPENHEILLKSARRFNPAMIRQSLSEPGNLVLGLPNPKLFIFGAPDPIISASAASKLENMGLKNSEIITIPKGGHAPSKAGLAKVLQEITRFIDQNI